MTKTETVSTKENRFRLFQVTLTIVCFFCLSLFTVDFYAQEQNPLNQSQQFEKQAVAAYQAKDLNAFLNNIKQAAALRPNHPRLLYILAKALALNGDLHQASKLLRRLASMGMAFRFENDKEFFEKFQPNDSAEITRMFAQNRQPLNQSERRFTLPEKDLIVESIAYDPATKRFFFGSVHRGKIKVIDGNNAISEFSSDADGLWSVLGMKVDEKRRVLWVCTAALPQFRGFQKTDEGVSALLKYDLNNNRLVKKYLLKDSTKHVLGDLVIGKNGDVFASDSVSPNIYRLNQKTDEIESFLTDKSFVSLQGLTFSPDEKTLFAADYSMGIFKINITTKKIDLIKPTENMAVLGIDGLYFHKGKLIAIQNGTNPQRLISLSLSKDDSRFTDFKTLEANHPDFSEPTHGVIVENKFYYIANSQWEMVNEKGEIPVPEKLQQPVVLRLKL
jgi:hypothetical protein